MDTPQVADFSRLIDGISVVMLTTNTPKHLLRSCPLLLEHVEPDGSLTFLTHRSSQKIDDIEHDPQVNVAFVSPDGTRYVSVAGRARMLADHTQAAELWNPTYWAWFPNGADDPDLAILRVTADRVEYWDVVSNRLVHLWDAARAIVTVAPAERRASAAR